MRKVLFLIVFLSTIHITVKSQYEYRDSLISIIKDPLTSAVDKQNAGKLLLKIQKARLNNSFEKKNKKSVIDAVEKTMSETEFVEDSLVEVLIPIATDTLVSLSNRKKAIQLLAQTNHKKAYNFLLSNITKIVFIGDLLHSEDELKNYFCFWSLLTKSTNDWNLFPSILDRLVDAEERDFPYLAMLVKGMYAENASDILKAFHKNAKGMKKYKILKLINELEKY